MSAPPDRRLLLLLDVIVVARRDPHVAQILRGGLERYLQAMSSVHDAAVAVGRIDPGIPTDELARVLALLRMGMIVFGALDESPPSDPAFAQLADVLLRPAGAGDEGDTPAALARVRGRADAAERARADLHEAIVEAVGRGHSLRQVGTAAGMSHERIRQLLREPDAPRQQR
jgi:hypothetical protein